MNAGYASNERFAEVVMTSRDAESAARKLGITRDAVMIRILRWKRLGVKGLPDFKKKCRKTEPVEIQKLIDRYRRKGTA